MLQPIDPNNQAHCETIASIGASVGDNCLSISTPFVQYNLLPTSGLIQESRFFVNEKGVQTGCIVASVLTSDELTSPPTHGWIEYIAVHTAFQGLGHGKTLISWAEGWLRDQGCTEVTLGAGIRTFVPGLPSESFSVCFFQDRGYRNSSKSGSGLVRDVASDLAHYKGSSSVKEIDGIVRPGKQGDERHLLDYLQREFPGRWHFETEMYLRDGVRISDSMLLWTEQGIDGFCWLTFEDSVRPMERYYPYTLPRPWGQLGAIGVSADSRGKGCGAAVLDAGLRRLRDNGVRGCVIDWTTLVDFYGKFGFTEYRSYMPMNKSLV